MVLHPAIKKAALDEVCLRSLLPLREPLFALTYSLFICTTQIYLDTTYLNPQYCFPPQPAVISSVAELTHSIVRGGHLPHQPSTAKAGGGVSGWLRKSESEEEKEEREMKERIKGERTLIVVGTYSVGKERLAKGELVASFPGGLKEETDASSFLFFASCFSLVGIAQRLGTKIYAEPRKRAYIDAQTDDPALTALMTLRKEEVRRLSLLFRSLPSRSQHRRPSSHFLNRFPRSIASRRVKSTSSLSVTSATKAFRTTSNATTSRTTES